MGRDNDFFGVGDSPENGWNEVGEGFSCPGACLGEEDGFLVDGFDNGGDELNLLGAALKGGDML